MRQRSLAVPSVVLYTRHRCHLCELVEDALEGVAETLRFDLSRVDIDRDEALRRAYGTKVPVVVIDGREAFVYRASEEDLRAALLQAGAHRHE